MASVTARHISPRIGYIVQSSEDSSDFSTSRLFHSCRPLCKKKEGRYIQLQTIRYNNERKTTPFSSQTQSHTSHVFCTPLPFRTPITTSPAQPPAHARHPPRRPNAQSVSTDSEATSTTRSDSDSGPNSPASRRCSYRFAIARKPGGRTRSWGCVWRCG